MWECIREARSHSLSFFRSTLTLALLLVFTLQMEREREQKIVFQMFTSQEVAVGLTSKVLKEIRKLEKQKFTFNKRRERERLACLHTLHWNPTLASEASLFMEGIADFSFCFSYLLVCSLLHSPAMNTGFTEHSHILGDSSSSFWFFFALILSPFIFSFFSSLYRITCESQILYACVCVSVTKEMEVFTIYLHEHGLSMNYRKSVLIYGRNVARNTLLTSFVLPFICISCKHFQFSQP